MSNRQLEAGVRTHQERIARLDQEIVGIRTEEGMLAQETSGVGDLAELAGLMESAQEHLAQSEAAAQASEAGHVSARQKLVSSRAPLNEAEKRVQRLRCPRCGEGRLFPGLLNMHEECSSCHLKNERAPGYFLGSIYVNYGFTAVAMTIGYLFLHPILGFTNRQLAAPLVGFCIVFATFFFRYARALWLSLDCFFDPTSFDMQPK